MPNFGIPFRPAGKFFALVLLTALAACNTVARSERMVPGAGQLASLPAAANLRSAIAEVTLIERPGTGNGLGFRATLLDYNGMADAVRASLRSRGMMAAKGALKLEIREPSTGYGFVLPGDQPSAIRIQVYMEAGYRLIRKSTGERVFDETVDISHKEPASRSELEFDRRGQPTPELQSAVEAAVRKNIVEFLTQLGQK
jgi:hypothetical protein